MPTVRDETPADRDAVRAVLAAAFGGPAEAELVDALRSAGGLTLSLVVEVDGAVAGHVAFSPVALEGGPPLTLLALGPMAVAPAHQGRGLGAQLARAGLDRCRGADGVVVLGHPGYYPRFGFVPAARFGLRCEFDAPPEAFMALPLRPGALDGAGGQVRYPAAFSRG